MVAAMAEIVPPDDRSTGALREKYGPQYRIISALERVFPRGRDRVILRITAEDAVDS